MRLKEKVRSSGRSILLIDDNEEYLRATMRILEREGHEVVPAACGPDGLEILRKRRVDLVLVDYFMPAMTGEQFVQELRAFDAHAQVIMQTGYASERPSREMLKRLDIQGYHDKTEGPEKLLLWVDVGLRAAFTVQLLNKSREGLAYILQVTPELHKVRPLEELLQGVLIQTAGLLGATDTLLAVASPRPKEAPGGEPREGFIAMAQPGGALKIRAATGRFVGRQTLADAFTGGELEQLSEAMNSGRARPADRGIIVPLRVGDSALGLIYVQGSFDQERGQELLTVFANQAAVAIHNASLYELAAVDQLTRVYTRRFFEEALLRELRTAHRGGAGFALMLVDVDDMKGINDRGGHLCGDQALAAVGALLRNATRATDVVGRYGGDEFAVVLSGADREGAEIVAQRVARASEALAVKAEGGGVYPVRVTVGAAVLPRAPERDPRRIRSEAFFRGLATRLISSADASLYDGKRAGKGRASHIVSEAWPGSTLPP